MDSLDKALLITIVTIIFILVAGILTNNIHDNITATKMAAEGYYQVPNPNAAGRVMWQKRVERTEK